MPHACQCARDASFVRAAALPFTTLGGAVRGGRAGRAGQGEGPGPGRGEVGPVRGGGSRLALATSVLSEDLQRRVDSSLTHELQTDIQLPLHKQRFQPPPVLPRPTTAATFHPEPQPVNTSASWCPILADVTGFPQRPRCTRQTAPRTAPHRHPFGDG